MAEWGGDRAIFLFRVFGPPAPLPGSKMTMMKKKMATNLAPATATLKPETRMENMEILLYLIQIDGRHRGGAKIFRKNAPSLATQCTICHRTQEAKEKAKVKKRGLYDSSAARKRKSYLPTILHP